MSNPEVPTSHATPWYRRSGRPLLVMAGLVLLQFVLFGPSLVGKKLLLPVDILASPGICIPPAQDGSATRVHNKMLSDRVYVFELRDQFAGQELRAGRLPLWNPGGYGGTPFVWATYSPFTFLHALFPAPTSLAWIEFSRALIAGLGAYVFFRRVMQLSFWPAAVCAWCYPLTAYFILWQGFLLVSNVLWLPWLLTAVDGTIRGHGKSWAAPGLALVTGLVMLSGAPDVGGQVLLASGLYALWRLGDHFRLRIFSRLACLTVFALTVAWLVGMLLSAVFVLPLVDHMKTGARMQNRAEGTEERPPTGLAALPQFVLPDVYGRAQLGWHRSVKGNRLESSASGFVGLIATLLVAPLAFCERRRLSWNLFWLALTIVSFGWQLNIPGLVDLLRQPGFNMLSHNRFVFAGAFALLAMAAVGLDSMWRQLPRVNLWSLLPRLALVILCVFSFCRVVQLPDPIERQLPERVQQGERVGRVATMTEVATVQRTYRVSALVSGLICLAACVGWQIVGQTSRGARQTATGEAGPAQNSKSTGESVLGAGHWLGPAVSLAMLLELLWYAHDVNPQCDPELYYPEIPLLTQLADSPAGRTLGVGCFPPSLNEHYGLRDIRGYDGVDPAEMIALLSLCEDTNYPSFRYARTQWFVPLHDMNLPDVVKPSPVLDMLNVRYFIFRGTPPGTANVFLSGNDYWVVENPDVLPRVFIPESVESLPDDSQILDRLAAPDFNPRETAYVTDDVSLPDNCSGQARIVAEIPTRIELEANMETPGLLVLGDRWDKGWRAYRDGKVVPILRTNHALRGVIVPAGKSSLEFRYEPRAFALGLRVTVGAAAILLAWFAIVGIRSRRRQAA